jgi:hypothetical protein
MKRKRIYWWRGSRYVTLALLALCGLQQLAFGSIAARVLGGIIFAGTLTIGTLSVRYARRYRRRECDGPRALLLALARKRAGADGLWLNREEHLVFRVTASGWGPGRQWAVARADEDQARELDDRSAGDRLAATAVAFTVKAAAPEVLRDVAGVVVVIGTDEEPAFEEQALPRLRRLKAVWLEPKALLSGHMFASAGELRELVSQFTAAELVSLNDEA